MKRNGGSEKGKASEAIIVIYHGEREKLIELAERFNVHPTTAKTRYARAGRPAVVTDEFFRPAIVGGGPKIPITLDGDSITMKALVKVAGVTEATLYKLIHKIGRDLKRSDLKFDLNKQRCGSYAGRKKQVIENSSRTWPTAEKVRDSGDSSPGWAERMYFPETGQRGFCSQKSTGSNAHYAGHSDLPLLSGD